jgi:class 3 adenylate cyclase
LTSATRFRGEERHAAGNGFFATFDGPAKAIRVRGDRGGRARLGLDVRAGMVLVSQTVKDLVAGAGVEFGDRGVHELKGIPGEWRLYAVLDA